MCISNDFSAKKFFAPDDIENDITSVVTYEEEQELPEVSGKSNFTLFVSDGGRLLYVSLIQSDMDNRSFKASTLRADTVFDGNSLSSIFADSTIQGCTSAIELGLGIEIDYFIAMDKSDFADFYDTLGSIHYPVVSEIKHKEEGSSPYTLKVKAGEQTIDGKRLVNLIRYYIDVEGNFSQANDLVLASLAQQLNEKNFADREDLFRRFSKIAQTNITIRDFSLAADKMMVASSESSAMGVYNAPVQYNENKISDEGLKKVKGYFLK